MINVWYLIDLAEKPTEQTWPTYLIVILQLIYILDSLWYEVKNLFVFTIFLEKEDVIFLMENAQEKPSFLSLFGDLVWIPFMNSLQTHYLFRSRTATSKTLYFISITVGRNDFLFSFYLSYNLT
jgi:hypothetical protein